jgi:hypothetical protein
MRKAEILMAAALAVCAQACGGELAPVAAAVRGASGSEGGGKPLADGAFGTAVAVRRLAALRGGADTVSNDMRLSGAVSGNTALNVVSGMNTISSGSFSNAAGLPVAIQNSGANVLIQNATIINIRLQ